MSWGHQPSDFNKSKNGRSRRPCNMQTQVKSLDSWNECLCFHTDFCKIFYVFLPVLRFHFSTKNKPTYPCLTQFACHLMISSRSSRRTSEECREISRPKTIQNSKTQRTKNLPVQNKYFRDHFSDWFAWIQWILWRTGIVNLRRNIRNIVSSFKS